MFHKTKSQIIVKGEIKDMQRRTVVWKDLQEIGNQISITTVYGCIYIRFLFRTAVWSWSKYSSCPHLSCFGSYHRAHLEHINWILDETNPEDAFQLPEVKKSMKCCSTNIRFSIWTVSVYKSTFLGSHWLLELT